MLDFNKVDVVDASNTLSDNAFKLWLYIVVDNSKPYLDRFFTSRNYSLRCGVSDSEFQEAWSELEERGYIAKDEGTWYKFSIG